MLFHVSCVFISVSAGVFIKKRFFFYPLTYCAEFSFYPKPPPAYPNADNVAKNEHNNKMMVSGKRHLSDCCGCSSQFFFLLFCSTHSSLAILLLWERQWNNNFYTHLVLTTHQREVFRFCVTVFLWLTVYFTDTVSVGSESMIHKWTFYLNETTVHRKRDRNFVNFWKQMGIQCLRIKSVEFDGVFF